jgi:hypothetical protein
MRAIGCLTVIALIVVGVVWWCSGKDMTDQERAQWAGEKAHRGWNKFTEFMKSAQEGWKKVPDKSTNPGPEATPTPTGPPRTVLP